MIIDSRSTAPWAGSHAALRAVNDALSISFQDVRDQERSDAIRNALSGRLPTLNQNRPGQTRAHWRRSSGEIAPCPTESAG
jgi:hypothetical protein